MSKKPKIIVILGPTASGKSALAVKIAKRFNGEIISADSRQVYRGMDIGTGKVPRDNSKLQLKSQKYYFHRGIQHYLLDVVSPKKRFTVAQYKKLALQAIKKIQQKGKLPIICGGTGFYIQAVVDNISIPEVKPDFKLRAKLEKRTAAQLFAQLKKLNPQRAKQIDRFNKRRLVRALEIVYKTGKPVPQLKSTPTFDVLMIGIKKSPQELKKLIHKRLIKRLRKGMIDEVKNLRKSGLSWRRLEEFGLEYRFVAQYLQGKISYQEMIDKIQKESEQYTKRQMTWFKRNKRICWIKNKNQAQKSVTNFLK